ncbi:MAG: hypothetical protein JXQ84_09880, partial [Rhodospirillaceae bacterium]|nr:hypothetical protein [Rhodospirillaceae bacterium]
MTSVLSPLPIVITMGDPSGIGAEVTVKALASLSPEARDRYVVIGDYDVMARACAVCQVEASFLQ